MPAPTRTTFATENADMTLVLVLAIVCIAGIVQGLTGFGSVLVALPLLALLLPMTEAVPFVCLVALCMNLQMLPELRGNIVWKPAALLTLASLPGLILGVLALRTISPSALSAILGAMTLAFSLRNPGRTRPLGTLSCLVAGFLSGWLNGAIGAGGPPAVAYASLQPWSKDEIKATLLAFFLVGGAGIVIAHTLSGLYTPHILGTFAASIPALILGVWWGTRWYDGMNAATYRKAVCIVLLLMGLLSLGKPMLTWLEHM